MVDRASLGWKGWKGLEGTNTNLFVSHKFTVVQMAPEAVFLVMCDPSMNELLVTKTHRDLCIGLSRSLTACSWKGHT